MNVTDANTFSKLERKNIAVNLLLYKLESKILLEKNRVSENKETSLVSYSISENHLYPLHPLHQHAHKSVMTAIIIKVKRKPKGI
jgi:hypothetical protein